MLSFAHGNGPNQLVATEVEPERGYGWLCVVIPTDARRFRATDPELASVLSEAGAELVEGAADVEIASARELRGDATRSIAVLGHPPSGERPFPVRAARRLANSISVRLEARRVRRAFRRLGYETVLLIAWDYHHSLHHVPIRGRRSRARLAEYLPERALVVGRGAAPVSTLLDAALAEASKAAGLPLQADAPSIRSGLLVVDVKAGILRIAVGPGSRQIRNQHSALDELRAGDVPPLVAERVPWMLARGRCGLADWSLEQRLPGDRPKPPVSGPLLADCLDFLVALHSSAPAGAHRGMLLEQAEVVGRAFPPEETRVLALAQRLEAALADLPRGFAHGDFFHGNLLVEGGRLVGVVDWDAAGPGRLPLLDLLHLRHTSVRELADGDWGPLFAQRLLPLARTGGDDVVRAYCRRAGLTLDRERLEALALAYWLDYVSYQLRTHAYRLAQPRWLERSIKLVLGAVAEESGRI